jgi:response regulator RpfG family c-di-GMP phosphodiesterase
MNRKILFVDDDVNILSGFERILRKKFQLVTAVSGEAGLQEVKNNGPFAVVISDFCMPNMDGVVFLRKCLELVPAMVRIMLTGQADFENTIHAVNEGNIFRFLVKPCSYEMLTKALEDGVRQFELVMAEKFLLDNTLKGSIKVLVEVLALANPEAFSRTSRVVRWMSRLARRLELQNSTEVELVGMLSQVGCVGLPPGILTKRLRGENLTPDEQLLFNSHPGVAKRLLEKIPRLETIAEAVLYQGKEYTGGGYPNDELKLDRIPLISRLLKAILDFDAWVKSGLTNEQAVSRMQANASWYDPRILGLLDEEVKLVKVGLTLHTLQVEALQPGMLLAGHVHDHRGMLLMAQGQEVTEVLKIRLLGLAQAGYIEETLKVLVRDGTKL